MEELVFLENEQAITTSRNVADNFDKRHDNVLKDIDNLLEGSREKLGDLFYENYYTHPH